MLKLEFNWVIKHWTAWEGEECLANATKPKRPRDDERPVKKARLEPGVAWGEGDADAEKVNFLHNQESSKPAKNQSRMKIYSGLE